mmetsp:Transcript_11612/g.39672  ORF Transcript_11612/g.39672 Transcript_11612/m.39672 type:complete len:315 (-) Transcript_11612:84-1028(-)
MATFGLSEEDVRLISEQLQLTTEQTAVLLDLLECTPGDPRCIAVQARAGCGKSTLCAALVRALRKHGGWRALYTTFNAEGAAKARRQLEAELGGDDVVEVNTLHAVVMSQLQQHLGTTLRLHEDVELEEMVRLKYVVPALKRISVCASFRKNAKVLTQTVVDHTMKAMMDFLQSDDTVNAHFAHPSKATPRTAHAWHNKAESAGGAPTCLRKLYDAHFYATTARAIWTDELSLTEDSAPFWTFDSVLKHFQLTKGQLTRYSAIMCDEAQDFNPCQLDILMNQHTRPDERMFFDEEQDTAPARARDCAPARSASQ